MGEIIHSIRIKGLKKIRRVNALFDSGTSTTYIREDLANDIGMVRLQKVSTFLADKRENIGILSEIVIIINKSIIPTRAIIVDKLDNQIIIGVDFMQSTKSFLDFSTDRLRLKDEVRILKNRKFRL